MTTKIYREAERRKLDYHDAWVELITQAEKALRLFVGRLEQHGEWDDGCFYYNGKSHPEFQLPLEEGHKALNAIKEAKEGP